MSACATKVALAIERGDTARFPQCSPFPNSQNLSPGGLQPQDIARLIEEFFRLAAGNSRRYGCQGHESLLVIGPAKGTRIIQILSAINYRFLGPNFR